MAEMSVLEGVKKPASLPQHEMLADVRYGSFATNAIQTQGPTDVRCCPRSGHSGAVCRCPLSAMYGRRPRCKGKIGHFSEAFGCSHVFGLFRLEDYLCRDAAAVAAGPDVIR